MISALDLYAITVQHVLFLRVMHLPSQTLVPIIGVPSVEPFMVVGVSLGLQVMEFMIGRHINAIRPDPPPGRIINTAQRIETRPQTMFYGIFGLYKKHIRTLCDHVLRSIVRGVIAGNIRHRGIYHRQFSVSGRTVLVRGVEERFGDGRSHIRVCTCKHAEIIGLRFEVGSVPLVVIGGNIQPEILIIQLLGRIPVELKPGQVV